MATKKASPTNKSSKSGKSKEPNSVRQMSEDINFMEFETRMRQLMRELLEPVIYKSKVDREMIFKLEKTDMDYEKRIDLLEQAVYHKKAEDGSTMFDDMEEKILNMDILLKSTTKQFAEQVHFTEKKFLDELFKTNQNVYQIQNYQQMIEENKRAVESCQLIVQQGIHDINKRVEANKNKSLKEMHELQDKIFWLENLCKSVPPQVADCVNQCTTIAETSDRLVDKIDQVEKKLFQTDLEKFSIKDQNEYNEKIQSQIMRCENATDKVANHTDELQNWIDIYMPLRLQSQITETIKECLPRKGKYLLGVAAQQINSQLRERMFTDIGHPDLKKRCLRLIEDLQLEADILTEKDKQMIREANENWKFDEEAEAQKKKVNSETLPKVDLQTGGRGVDADSEVLGKLQEDMEQFAIEECKKTFYRAEDLIKNFSDTTMRKLATLDIQLNSMNNQQSAFINALKDEVENSAQYQRRQNQDTLGLIKGLSTTLKKQKDTQSQSQENFEKLKHTIHLIAQQQNLLSNFVSMLHSDGLIGQQSQSQLGPNLQIGNESEGNENLTATIGGLSLKKQQTSVAKFNGVQGRTSKADQSAMKAQLYAKLVKDTQANMKKLQVSLFKNNFKKSLLHQIGQSLIEHKQPSQDNDINTQASAVFELPSERKASLTTRKPQQSSSKNNSIAINTEEQGPNYEIRELSPNHNIIQTRIITKQNMIQNMRQHDEIQSPQTVFQNSNNNLREHQHISEPDMGQKSNLNSSSPSDVKLRYMNNYKNNEQMISSPKLDAATSLRDLDRRLDIKFSNSPSPLPQNPKSNRINIRSNAFNHQSITTKDNSKVNRYASAMKVQNEDVAVLEGTSQSFDFSMLDPTLNQRNKRGSMPVGAVNVQYKKGTSSAIGNYQQIQASPFKLDGEVSQGQSSSIMNQSFGFGPLNISRAKYGSQERNLNQSMMVSGLNSKNLLKQANVRQSVQETTKLPNI